MRGCESPTESRQTISRGSPRRKLWGGYNTLYDFSPFCFSYTLRDFVNSSSILGRDTFKSSSRLGYSSSVSVRDKPSQLRLFAVRISQRRRVMA